jgi:hypothetical protein
MGVDHLQGKRTGRPRGAKTTPPYIRAARWAYENLDVADAVPPSPLAARLIAFWRKRPDRLVVYMATLDEMKRKADGRKRARRRPRLKGAVAGAIVNDGPIAGQETDAPQTKPPAPNADSPTERMANDGQQKNGSEKADGPRPPEVRPPCYYCGGAAGAHFRHCKYFDWAT